MRQFHAISPAILARPRIKVCTGTFASRFWFSLLRVLGGGVARAVSLRDRNTPILGTPPSPPPLRYSARHRDRLALIHVSPSSCHSMALQRVSLTHASTRLSHTSTCHPPSTAFCSQLRARSHRGCRYARGRREARRRRRIRRASPRPNPAPAPELCSAFSEVYP